MLYAPFCLKNKQNISQACLFVILPFRFLRIVSCRFEFGPFPFGQRHLHWDFHLRRMGRAQRHVRGTQESHAHSAHLHHHLAPACHWHLSTREFRLFHRKSVRVRIFVAESEGLVVHLRRFLEFSLLLFSSQIPLPFFNDGFFSLPLAFCLLPCPPAGIDSF